MSPLSPSRDPGFVNDPLLALGPLDGRYAAAVADLRPVFSEFGLIRSRIVVELAWFRALCAHEGIPEARSLTDGEFAWIELLEKDFDLAAAREVKSIENTTRHDVKAVEYYLKARFAGTTLEPLREFLHFACTSEDINNLAHALMLREGLALLRAAQNRLTDNMAALAKATRSVAMLAHTHGQPASPTTVGKELAVFVHRLRQQGGMLDALRLSGKLNGAVGNYNAHLAAYPKVDWPTLARGVIEDTLGFAMHPLTTQIEPHDGFAECFDILRRWNTVLLDFDRDMWSYISMGYFTQRISKGEVGSSTMPHKVNPIDFENSEGNIGIANALLEHLARKLPVSRMQRDLSDSTVLRNVGVAFGHSLLACSSASKGLDKISVNASRIEQDLNAAWEVMAEPIQTLMRKAGLPDPYEQLKGMTQGRSISAETIRDFVSSLDMPEADKLRLLDLTPNSYIGLAAELADNL